MLQNLSIRNYALIEELDISFSEGMTTITGETGAGKSILLGALSLLIGARADSSALMKKSAKCVVEGTFRIDDYHLEDFFTSRDLDYESPCLIRREINAEGKSRAFVNDTPVNLSILKELGHRLIEIHSQHETLTLNESGFQMMVVDSFAGNKEALQQYSKTWQAYNECSIRLKELKSAEEQSKKDADYYRFLFNELEEIKLTDGEQEKNEAELEILNNSEEIKSVLLAAGNAISGDENNLLSSFHSVLNALQSVAKVFPKTEELITRLKSAQIELRDIASDIEHLEREVNVDPEKAARISDRLDIIYKLQQKHKVQNVADLLQLQESFSNKLNRIDTLDSEIQQLEKDLLVKLDQLRKAATSLSKKRHGVLSQIEKNVAALLAELGMKHAILKIELEPLATDQFRANGADAIRFLFSANKGVEYRELSKVASGGELSRLMLAIKSIIAKLSGLPTILFDEIDTGVSGEVAHKVGNILKSMSAERQVIAITHLPQMAVKGEEHLFVYKVTGKNTTTTAIRKLNDAERIEEIAKMLSGAQPSKTAMANARELLGV